MPPGPAVVIIARHGARLDAADKTWHLTSPTPYDPPLTYGGWSQSKALGIRIAALLHAREESEENGVGTNGSSNGLESVSFGAHDTPALSANTKSTRTTKRKQKIIIHSSPYHRCVQTSIAISAGISQYQPPVESTPKRSHSPKAGANARPGSPKSRAVDSRAQALSSIPEPSIPEPEDDPALNVFRKSLRRKAPEKTTLRIDAFLGEWLSPDYFENITPPPNSTMMVAGAKADLLRRGEYIEVPQNPHSSKGHFPGGWVKASSQRSPSHSEDSPLSSLGSLAQALPLQLHNRSNSQGSVGSTSSRTSQHRGTTSLSTSHKVASNVYDPPVPTYAVSPSDPIPRGYVAHARDACVDVDYQWDSMRAPEEWGDGGEYGDEWSTMHKRFRRGLAGMMAWYKKHGAGGSHDKFHEAISGDSEDDGNDDSELVLVLVTHGAGCNALLGAISNQPVLLDVGMASLSMAVRKDGFPLKTPSSPPLPGQLRRSPVDLGMSEDYEMKTLASLDHLRPGVDPAKLSDIPAPPMLASPIEYRRRLNPLAPTSPTEYPYGAAEPFRGINSSLGSMRRSSTTGSSSSRLFAPSTTQNSSTTSMTGLWSRTSSNLDTASTRSASPGADLVLNFPEPKLGNALTKTVSNQSENDDVAPLPTVQKAVTGLWGPAPVAARTDLSRVSGPKRRWTVTERREMGE